MGSRDTRIHLKELIKKHKPAILAVTETRIHSSRVMDFLIFTGFTDMVAVEAAGFFGGIWLLWDCNVVTVEPIALGDQIITVLVKELDKPWLLSIIYASPKVYLRLDLW